MNERVLRLTGTMALVVGATTLGTAGCGGPAEAPAAADAGSGRSAKPQAAEVAEAPAIELRAVDRAAFDALIAEQRGKVVLVDFWATWCAPCLKQLPHTAELGKEHADDGLVVVTVSVDEPEDEAKAAKRIAELAGDAPGTHLRSSLGGGSAAMEAFEIGSGSAPHYKLYDREGKLRQVFENDPAAERPFTADDIDSAVEMLLDEQAQGNDSDSDVAKKLSELVFQRGPRLR
jgi:thiol-disulfide isomerase/thioredoxin